LRRPFCRSRRIYAVLTKSLLYGAGVLILGYAERIGEAAWHGRSLTLAVRTVLAHSDLHRLLAITMGVTLVFAAYFAMSDISDFMGEGGMREFFFKNRDPMTG
jgi:hypothetical protein